MTYLAELANILVFPPFMKVKFSKVFMFIKNIINIYNLVYNLFFNNYPPI